MKKQFLFTAMALATFFIGCSDEETPNIGSENKVKFFIDGPASRVVTNGNATTFEAGDQVAINSSGLAPEMENEIFTVGADGSLNADLSFYYDGNKSAKFYAYYPTSAIHSEGNVTHTVPAVQQGEEQYNANDFMTSTATGSPTTNNGAVSLKFSHRLSLVKIIWEGSKTATDIEMFGIKPTVVWNYATDAVTAGGNATNIVMWKIATDKQEYWALIPSQTIAKGTKLLEIRDGDKVYPYTPNVDLAFNDKQVKKITLTTKEEEGSTEAVATSISIEDWVEDTTVSEGDLTATILPPDTLISPDMGKFTGVEALTLVSKAKTKAGIWGYAANKDAKVELITEDTVKVLHINIPKLSSDLAATDSCRWWNNAMYYQLTDEAAKGIKPGKPYRLTLKLKAGTADKGAMVQILKADEATNTYFGMNNKKTLRPDTLAYTNRMYYPALKPAQQETGYNELVYYVNFASVLDAAGKVRETPGTLADFGQVVLMISINTGNSAAQAYDVDFYVKDITLEECIIQTE